MEFNATFIVSVISFIIFTLLMNEILYKPVSKIVEEREHTIMKAQKNLKNRQALFTLTEMKNYPKQLLKIKNSLLKLWLRQTLMLKIKQLMLNRIPLLKSTRQNLTYKTEVRLSIMKLKVELMSLQIIFQLKFLEKSNGNLEFNSGIKHI